MSRITLVEAIRAYNVERGLEPEKAEAETQRVRSLLPQMRKGSADIHLHDFYFVALEEGGEFYVDSDQLEAALEHFRALRRAGTPDS